MPSPLVRLEGPHGAVYLRPEHVHCIVPTQAQVDDGGVTPQSIVQVMLPDIGRGPAGQVQIWNSIGWIVRGTPDEVAAVLWPSGART